jgi:glycosyltransferase involved in cell wall biosynthesis
VGRAGLNHCPVLKTNLAKHTWIASLPHYKILELMREHDVLVFPSLFEGFGMVITEAMAQGTPVITTDRTAGPDIINDGQNGWLINAGSAGALQAALEKLLIRPHLIAAVGQAALATAAKRPWSVYGSELAGAVNGE